MIPKMERILSLFNDRKWVIAMWTSVVSGLIVGIFLRVSVERKWPQRKIMYIGFIGEIYLRMLQCLLLPLSLSSIIIAIGSFDLTSSGKIGRRAVQYYLITAVIVVSLGAILVSNIRPGEELLPLETFKLSNNIRSPKTIDAMLDLIRNAIPSNIIQAFLQQFETVLMPSSDNASEY